MRELVVEALSKYSGYLLGAQFHGGLLMVRQEQMGKTSSSACDYSEKAQLLSLLDKRLSVIAYWMDLLNTNEAYVVREKLMNGHDWDHVLDEYKVGFGQPNKCVRSLMGY